MFEFIFSPIDEVLNLKTETVKALSRLKLTSVRDLLFYAPYAYKIMHLHPNLRNVPPSEEVIVSVKIEEIRFPTSKKSPLKIYTSYDNKEQQSNYKVQRNNDYSTSKNFYPRYIDSSHITLVFFNKIPSFIMSKLRPGLDITISGKLQVNDGFFQITHPEFILKNDMIAEVEPIYHLTYAISNKQLMSYIRQVLEKICLHLRLAMELDKTDVINSSEEISEEIFFNKKSYIFQLIELVQDLHLKNFPANRQIIEHKMTENRRKLAAFELFSNQAMLHKVKNQSSPNKGHIFSIFREYQDIILSSLGFVLTDGQRKSIEEIENDLSSPAQMMRLLQGDVGSGKTLVALLTMINVLASGYQCAFMAPTDLLSNQHYEFINKSITLAKNFAIENKLEFPEVKVSVLTGKTKAKDKKSIKGQLLEGGIDILIGTHALFQEDIKFSKLGYVIIDEQHRFGVEQRLELINRGEHPDVLVMTATPIPRSLTLTLFGDMSVSQILTKPKNRLPIITSAFPSSKLEMIIDSLKKKIEDGEKIYWVCPLIDSSDKTLVKLDQNDEEKDQKENIAALRVDKAKQDRNDVPYSDVTSRFDSIDKIYPDTSCILHGKVKSSEKDKIMQNFKDGLIKILVSTTVIEVGIDVPDATLIIIENAEKFGLAQLHQLRGRVGRGSKQSYCFLIYNEKRLSSTARNRIDIMRKSSDGFYIAEQDLILRGGGDILGTKQSGEPEFHFANLGYDMNILLKINKIASNIKLYDEFVDFQVRLFSSSSEDLLKSG